MVISDHFYDSLNGNQQSLLRHPLITIEAVVEEIADYH
jgi:hypothetical protein